MFSEDVFVLWDKFRKYMPGSSERAFLKSLNSISEENCRVRPFKNKMHNSFLHYIINVLILIL